MNNNFLRVRSILVLIEKGSSSPIKSKLDLNSPTTSNCLLIESPDKRFHVYFFMRRKEEGPDNNQSTSGTINFLLGDYCSDEIPTTENPTGSSTLICWNPQEKYPVEISTSIVGLPPVFIHETPDNIILTSDLYLLSSLTRTPLYFDPEGLRDFAIIGYPIKGRTLFRDVRLIPGGSRLTINATGQVHESYTWKLIKNHDVSQGWDEYVDNQAESFKRAMGNIDLENSFLSLTAGLDTRAILAALIHMGQRIPACTMTGPNSSLDAIAARTLCKHYNLEHRKIVLGEDFFEDIVSCVTEASRLSGGLSSLTQAHEVHFNRKTTQLGFRRLSGNYGNQVGRRGVERISRRNANLSLLTPNLMAHNKQLGTLNWMEEASAGGGVPDHEFLLRQEIAFSSVGNYCIGNNYATQQVPYGRRELLNNLANIPYEPNEDLVISLKKMRLRDLKHRFLGHTPSQSFQIKVIRDVGGYVARYPINWGWRACGGVSLPGLALGLFTAGDALLSTTELYEKPILGKLLQHSGLKGLHEYTEPHVWIRKYLKDFALETLRSGTVAQSGVFNGKYLNHIIDEFHHDKTVSTQDILFALDIALACQLFKASL